MDATAARKHSRIASSLVRGGGGCEIRTREGLPPTRFPTMRTSVHRRPSPCASWAYAPRTAANERVRTGVNETTFETDTPATELAVSLDAKPGFHRATGSMRSSWRSSSSSWDARYRSTASWPLSQNCGEVLSALASRRAVEGE